MEREGRGGLLSTNSMQKHREQHTMLTSTTKALWLHHIHKAKHCLCEQSLADYKCFLATDFHMTSVCVQHIFSCNGRKTLEPAMTKNIHENFYLQKAAVTLPRRRRRENITGWLGWGDILAGIWWEDLHWSRWGGLLNNLYQSKAYSSTPLVQQYTVIIILIKYNTDYWLHLHHCIFSRWHSVYLAWSERAKHL